MSLKLKLNTGKATADGSAVSPSTAAPASASTTGGGGGFRIKINNSQPPTPAPLSLTHEPVLASPDTAKKPKGRPSKKRAANDDTISPAAKRPTVAAAKRTLSLKPRGPPAPSSASTATPTSARLKVSLKRHSTVPKLKTLNVKRPIPPRAKGVGYDSEDSDAEADPAIPQGFILRMPADADADAEYLRSAISNGKVGVQPSEGPAEVSMRFIDRDMRRAVVHVRGTTYAAVLVDLPCIVEAMKSWDRKGWWKVVDVAQMLLVLGPVGKGRGGTAVEEEVKAYPLPREVDPDTMQYAHGLTPPMHWVRKRRFRKRVSYKTIANVEEEVERLLREDALAEESGGKVTREILDHGEDLERSQEPEYSEAEEDDEEMDAIETVENGEYAGYGDEGADAADLEGDLQAMFDEADDDPAILPSHLNNAAMLTDSPAALTADQAFFFPTSSVTGPPTEAISTPAAETPAQNSSDHVDDAEDFDTATPAHATSDDNEDDDDDDDEDDDEEDDEPMDEDAAARAAERNQQKEEAADLAREVANQARKAASLTNQLLKDRALRQLRELEQELAMKRGAFGLDEEEEDVEDDAEGEEE